MTKTIAIIGGDEREQEIARRAVATGARVRAFGFPLPPEGIDRLEVPASLEQALAQADVAVLPIPGVAHDGSLFAPEHPEPIILDDGLLSRMSPGAHVILGAADARLRGAADAAGVTLHEYEHDTELMLLRAPSIVEGALQLAIANTDRSLHGSEVVVVGFGNIGERLAATLLALGARVTVAARNATQRAKAYSIGAQNVALADLPGLLPRTRMLFSTVPSTVITEQLLALLPARSLVMDLAAPPGGIDLSAAERHGHRAIWARGLGRRAPITVGASQWRGIARILDDIEDAQS